MQDTGWSWAVFTLIAAAAQTARNATQRSLTARLGTVGATHVRFLFGLPFALVFMAGIVVVLQRGLPTPNGVFCAWVAGGAIAQIAATALMLAAMGQRSFVVTTAYIKTEPIQVALFGFVLLGDVVTPLLALAIAIATAGVVIMALKPGAVGAGGLRATALGLAAGAGFGLSAIGFRGAILALHHADHVTAASFTLVAGLLLQCLLLTGWLVLTDRAVLVAIFRAWKPSLAAGFMGALASQFWFLAFALATAASVRTLALVEVLFAQGVSRYALGQRTTTREGIGIVLIVVGVVLLIHASGALPWQR
jgi:drug/metabolite transporter (DMT)-like permease